MTTRFRHVYENKLPTGKPLYVMMKIRGQNINVGYYSTIPEAVAAAQAFRKAIKLFGPKPSTLWRRSL